MKRILLSIGSSVALVTAYLIVSSTVFVVSGQNNELLPYLDLPMRLPKILFFYLFPPTSEDFAPVMNQKKLFLASFAYIGNALLYAIPAYILFTLVLRRRRVEVTQVEPPQPPLFVN